MIPKLQHLMQEQLDGVLEEEQVELLYEKLSTDEKLAAEFARLEKLDVMLSKAPLARAPQRLAATIMARLAQKVQEEAKLQEMPEEIQQALQLSLSMVILSMTPMMVMASWMVLNARMNPKLLTRVLERTIALLVMMIDALIFLLQETEYLAQRHPEKAAIAYSLIPVVLKGMTESMYHNPDEADE